MHHSFVRVVLILIFLACSSLCLSANAYAAPASWYVSKSITTSGNGQSWGTAWRDTTNIDWTVVKPGDTIWLDGGGTAGYSYSTFTTKSGGNSTARLYIKRSEEGGRDGPVTLGAKTRIEHPYITVDGGHYSKFFIGMNATLIGLRPESAFGVFNNADYFEIRNASFIGTYAAGGGHSLGIDSNHATVHGCYFVKSPWEDQMKFTGSGSLTITHSVFLDNPFVGDPAVDPHRDMINPYQSGGFDLIVRGNIFRNLSLVFLLQTTSILGNVEFSNNVFSGFDTAIRFGSGNKGAASVKIFNNIFYNGNESLGGYTTGIVSTLRKNNITKTTGSSAYKSDSGATLSNLKFKNPGVPIRADGVPFTADDGFNIPSDSSAVDAGADTGLTSDILGNPIQNAPDLGAYEYISPSTSAAPSAPSNLQVLP